MVKANCLSVARQPPLNKAHKKIGKGRGERLLRPFFLGMKDFFAVYIHWPFCASKCPYCDFNSHVAETIDHAAWAEAYRKEIQFYASKTPGRIVTSIFFGGGTPSLMDPDTVADVVSCVQRAWRVSNDVEITLEANPTSIEADKFRAFKTAGVNRVSIGVQSLVDQDLKFLGRQHDAGQARRALEIAAETFDRYSFDLIYARPEQRVEDWRRELREALPLAKGHLSLYQLTIEKGTPFYTQHARGEFRIPEDDAAGEFYEVTQEVLGAAGLPAYEISNHAAPGQESRHNLAYWQYDDYVGIGPGAHGRLTVHGKKYATRGHRAPEVWMDKVQHDGQGGHPFEEIDAGDRFTEAMMMGLRLREGVDLDRLSRELGADWQARISPKKINQLCDQGFLSADSGSLKPTPAGMQRLNSILGYLL